MSLQNITHGGQGGATPRNAYLCAVAELCRQADIQEKELLGKTPVELAKILNRGLPGETLEVTFQPLRSFHYTSIEVTFKNIRPYGQERRVRRSYRRKQNPFRGVTISCKISLKTGVIIEESITFNSAFLRRVLSFERELSRRYRITYAWESSSEKAFGT